MNDATSTEWERVRIAAIFSNRGKTDRRVHELDRAAIEEAERESMREVARSYRAADPELADAWEERADDFTITPEEFRQRVLNAATELATSPFRVPGDATNVVRILPPWALREVEITVLNTPSLVLPS